MTSIAMAIVSVLERERGWWKKKRVEEEEDNLGEGGGRWWKINSPVFVSFGCVCGLSSVINNGSREEKRTRGRCD